MDNFFAQIFSFILALLLLMIEVVLDSKSTKNGLWYDYNKKIEPIVYGAICVLISYGMSKFFGSENGWALITIPLFQYACCRFLIFDLMINFLKDLDWFYLGSTADSDNLFKKINPFYLLFLRIFTFIFTNFILFFL
jgi:hypothetical protein